MKLFVFVNKDRQCSCSCVETVRWWGSGWTANTPWKKKYTERICQNQRMLYVDRTPIHNPHLCSTNCSQARSGTHKQRHGSRIAVSSLCAWKEPSHLLCFMSHPWLFSHLPFTTSTSSSSFTLPSMTQEPAAQSVQQEQLREHSVHPAPLQAPSVDKLRHQGSFWRKDLQSGGNPRTTTPTHSSRPDDLWKKFLSELGPVSVAWRKTSRQPTGGCELYTHNYST